MYKVLIIEDDERIGNLIKDYFSKEGFQVILEADGIEGYAAFNSNSVNLIILDVMLPSLDGFSIAKRIRKKSNVPIIMVTARSDDEDQLMGYEFKVDDYITKPFNPEILIAKAKNLLERLQLYKEKDNEDIFETSDLKVDFLKRRVFIENEESILEPKQFDILKYLILNKNKVISREELLNKLWGYDYFGSDRVVDTQIRKLRKNLGSKAYLIKTVFSVGYSFEEE
ncbi:response regulator transcription factor [Bacillus thuringiensis]|uniref:Response regulator transcription factor n=1 Tax=Bacillus thuringiensis serovar andalousiensis TaxID=257985 RepID=A0A6H0TQM2_BACTU|nr:response regulator transcription factor [Bacillus thuringiensis]QIW22038.1 response regulator transcription factor [Bacillus thuringiensis serovar andalousiensis]